MTLTTPLLMVICYLSCILGLDISYLYTQFDYSIFSRYRDMVGAHQKLNCTRNLNLLSDDLSFMV